jgi:hypothetical protein
MLLAIVDSGASPAACFDRFSKSALNDLALPAKAAAVVRARLGPEVWGKLTPTCVRPAETMLRFERPWPANELVPSTHMVFGNVEIDQSGWPLLLHDFLVQSNSQNGIYLTTLDHNGNQRPYQRNNPDELFWFTPCSERSSLENVRYGNWQVHLRENWTLWSSRSRSTSFDIFSGTCLQAPHLHGERFPRCFKILEINQHLKEDERERIRIKVRLDDLSSGTESQMVFERLKRFGPWEAKLTMPYQVCHPYKPRPEADEWVNFIAYFSQYKVREGFYSIRMQDSPSCGDGTPTPPFNFKMPAGFDPYPEMAELGGKISAVEKIDLETIFGKSFLVSPPEFLHDLFVNK